MLNMTKYNNLWLIGVMQDFGARIGKKRENNIWLIKFRAYSK